MKRKRPTPSPESVAPADNVASPLRIIGGEWRGRKLHYHGESHTRPMKDRVREAVFNLLGPNIRGKHVFDVFAGTGAIGLEALSRGAAHATFVEQHFPTANIIRDNARSLGAEKQISIVPGNAFIWGRRLPVEQRPWVVFISPPWDFFLERATDMQTLIANVQAGLPPESTLVVEADERFDVGSLPQADGWDVRVYPPAVLAFWQSPPAA